MAHEAQGKTGTMESLSEQEMQELTPEAIQNEIEGEEEGEGEAEVEASPEEIETEALETVEITEAAEVDVSPRRRALLGRFIIRQSIRAVLVYTRAVVRRMQRNASLRRKLAAASRRGPRAVRALLAPVVLRAMPKPFRRSSRRLVGLVVALAFRGIARNAGLATHEIDAAEFESEST
jgi:hypothetical protein